MCCSPGSSVRERDLLIQIRSQLPEMLHDLFSKLLRGYQNHPSRSPKAIACILLTKQSAGRQSPRNPMCGEAHPQLVSRSVSSELTVCNKPPSFRTPYEP